MLSSYQSYDSAFDDVAVSTVVQQSVRQPKNADSDACRADNSHVSPVLTVAPEAMLRSVAYASLTSAGSHLSIDEPDGQSGGALTETPLTGGSNERGKKMVQADESLKYHRATKC